MVNKKNAWLGLMMKKKLRKMMILPALYEKMKDLPL